MKRPGFSRMLKPGRFRVMRRGKGRPRLRDAAEAVRRWGQNAAL